MITALAMLFSVVDMILLTRWLAKVANTCWLSRLGVVVVILGLAGSAVEASPGSWWGLMVRGGLCFWLVGRILAAPHKNKLPES